MVRWSDGELELVQQRIKRGVRVKEKRPRIKSTPTTVDGIKFQSEREAKRYEELKLLVSAGEISNLRLQYCFPIVINGKRVCDYIADFVYVEHGVEVVEDAKGHRTEAYQLKKRLMRAVHGIVIRES